MSRRNPLSLSLGKGLLLLSGLALWAIAWHAQAQAQASSQPPTVQVAPASSLAPLAVAPPAVAPPAVAPAAAPRSASRQAVPFAPDVPDVIELVAGQAQVLTLPEVRRIAVGNGQVLQVKALDARQLLLLPEATGSSTVHLWGRRGEERRLVVHVSGLDAGRLVHEINDLLGSGGRVQARVVGDRVLLEGASPTEDDSFRVQEIVKRYPQVINLVSRAGFEQMIDMEVRMIEIGRNALERLGVRWQSGSGTPWAVEGPSFGLIGDFKRSDAFGAGGAAAAAGFAVRPRIGPFATAASLVSSLSSMIDLMVQSGDAAVLAEPRLSCRSGGSARFVAGGELPIPVLGANGSASVQFKEYGIRFEVSPTVNELGVISARLHTEISSINPEVTVRDVPGLRKQSASTDVNLREGETLVIAGMVSNEISTTVDRLPGLGDVPVLGKLFRSRRFQNRESEMIVLITPRLHGGAGGTEQAARQAGRAASMAERFEQARHQLQMLD